MGYGVPRGAPQIIKIIGEILWVVADHLLAVLLSIVVGCLDGHQVAAETRHQ